MRGDCRPLEELAAAATVEYMLYSNVSVRSPLKEDLTRPKIETKT